MIRLKSFLDSIKQDFVFIIGNYGLRLASFIFTILVAKKISPENYGLFGLATLIITYLTYFNLGSQYSINKELSIDIKNRKVNAYAIINSFFFSLFVISFAIVIYWFDIFKELHRYIYYLILYPIFFNILEISNGILRAHFQSNQLGLIKLGGTALVVIVTVYYFFVGVPDDPSPLFSRFLLFQAVEVALSLFFLLKVFKISLLDLKLSFDKKYLRYLLQQGILLSFYITIDSFTKSIDRLFIATFYDKTDLGYYTFGVSLQGPFLLAIGSVMYMDFSRIMKKFNNITKEEFNSLVKVTYKKLTLIWIATLLFAIISCFFFLKYFLPNYFSSYYVVCIYIFNYLTQIFIFPYSTYFISNNRTLELIKIILIPSFINILLSFIVVALDLHYVYILIATLPANIIYVLLLKSLFEKKLLTYKF